MPVTLLEAMTAKLGIQEAPGSANNPAVIAMFKAAGHDEITTDSTPWCSVTLCAAAKEAGLPIPPVNINMTARSWLTMGITVAPDDVQAGDVAVWPRGSSKWEGHVNVVEKVDGDFVSCIGGNQKGPKGDAVTRSARRHKSEAAGFRRLVPATVKDLRAAGSTTIKSADAEEKIGIAATFFAPLFEGGREIINGMPSVSTTEGLTYLQTAAKMAMGAIAYVGTNPWVLSFTIAGLLIWLNSVRKKRSRVAEHANGIPLASEVAKLGTA